MNRLAVAEARDHLERSGFVAHVIFDGPKGYGVVIHTDSPYPTTLYTKTATKKLIKGEPMKRGNR